MKILTLLSLLFFYRAIALIPENGISLEYDTFVISNPNSIKNIFKNDIFLETDRLILRQIRSEDADDILDLASHPQVTQYTAALELIHTKKDAQELIAIMTQRYQLDLPTRWAIVYKPENKVIGICGFVGYSASFCRAEIGYALNYTYWGKGIATEATKAIIEFGFNHMHLNRIEATVDPNNQGSIHVIEKVGMKYEGTLRQHIWSKDEYRDRLIYSVLKNEYLLYRH